MFRLGAMNYEVLDNGKVWKRHVDQLLKSCELTKADKQLIDDDDLMDFQLPLPTDESITQLAAGFLPHKHSLTS